jgi:hypothetical protein
MPWSNPQSPVHRRYSDFVAGCGNPTMKAVATFGPGALVGLDVSRANRIDSGAC